ncbi:MAG: hypothetical protein OXN89_19780 [Bryobacterales bacterium]|nr:hypothetical protein [Bryobacterales bacterium]
MLKSGVGLRGYPGSLRQLTVADLSHENPILLPTNQTAETPTRLVNGYARLVVIGNTIADTIDFSHVDALSSAVPLRLTLDPQLTVIACSLSSLLGQRVAQGFESAKCATIFCRLVRTSATIDNLRQTCHRALPPTRQPPPPGGSRLRRAAAPTLWLENRTLTYRFS